MRVSIECDSPLLQRSLELFLRGHICAYEESDLVIRDHEKPSEHKTVLRIGNEADADLRKPFSKEALWDVIDAKLKTAESPVWQKRVEGMRSSEADFAVLEAQIERMTQEYKTNIIKAVRTFYEKK
jgi:hypothetical protein